MRKSAKSGRDRALSKTRGTSAPKSGPGAAASGGPEAAAASGELRPSRPEIPGLRWLSRRRLRRLAALPAKIPEKLEEGLEKGLVGAAEILRDPVGTAHKVIDTLQAPRGLAMGWAIALLLPVLLYILDLGSGSLWQDDDALIAKAVFSLSRNLHFVPRDVLEVPPPRGTPLGLLQMALAVRLLGLNEAALRLVPMLAALGCAMCLLAVAIDVGVGRHAGGLAGLVLLAMPLTYELSHRVLPETLIALASTGAVALVSHSLHGHKFDRHILPFQKEAEEPEPLPLRRLPMLFASLGIGAAAFVDPRAGLVAFLFALLDMLISHRYLLRKRRAWAMLAGGLGLIVIAAWLHPLGPRVYLGWHGWAAASRNFLAIWHQGTSWYGRHSGPIVIVATGFGLLLGSLRRASRPLLAWVLVATAMTTLGDPSVPPRGLGLVLPPLALAAAVGLQSPVRWLGSLGGLVTAGALAGIVVATIEGDVTLHKSDTLKLLAESQQHAPVTARLCTLAMPSKLLSFYARRPIDEFDSVAELKRSLGPGQPFSCLVPLALVPAVQLAFAPPRPPPAPPAPAPAPAGGAHRGHPKPAAPPAAKPAQPAEPLESVLATTLDIEEAPPDIAGPKVALISR